MRYMHHKDRYDTNMPMVLIVARRHNTCRKNEVRQCSRSIQRPFGSAATARIGPKKSCHGGPASTKGQFLASSGEQMETSGAEPWSFSPDNLTFRPKCSAATSPSHRASTKHHFGRTSHK